MDLTLLIPTKNKSFLLEKVIKYYSSLNFEGKIIVLDSSAKEDYEKNSQIIKTNKNIEVSQEKIVGTYFDVLSKIMLSVRTKYVVCSGDDDFYTTSGLIECINFLEINNNYLAVHGLSITITLDDKNYNNVKSADLYKLPTCTQDTALERLNYISSNYGVTNFSVHRSKIFSKICVGVFDEGLKDHGLNERLNSFLSAVHGKIGNIPRLTLVRSIHSSRDKLVEMSDFRKEEDYSNCKSFFINKISSALSEKDNLPLEKTKEIIVKDFDKLSGKVRKVNKKNFIKKNLYIVKFYKFFKFYFVRNEISLKSLLNKSSPHYKDFIGIYNIVRNSSQN